jgi:hypothetical protein
LGTGKSWPLAWRTNYAHEDFRLNLRSYKNRRLTKNTLLRKSDIIDIDFYMLNCLPPAFDNTRIQIRRVHVKVFWLIVVFYVALLSLLPVFFRPHEENITIIGAFFILLVLLNVMFVTMTLHLSRLCRKLGFICPHCGKSLYEVHGRIFISTGCCPKCRKLVV